ncbi:hypothetical protein M409DRAFT_59469 [Zasmidium cellare ATCC 36951]|uniref:Uncharacterized protein n=1 Tax=Zasmidium cellare ATCC 36951 TaxID=1080233 RepID=A0A6A6C1Q2_ZASCE|nr:uncharacterized protein M409DRAFT_59469 [Zasmidium cellare ATCC 36951]KAF2160941.1 hypothetical protein M409DRAFT_59469 [Zasmidium cellare ATCC 36951]
MAVLSKQGLAVLAAAAWTQTTSATRVAFMSEENCLGTIMYMAPNVTQEIQCYDLTGYDGIPSVDVLNTTPGLVVNFFSDSKCQNAVAAADVDGCNNDLDPFGSWSITRNASAAADTTDLETVPGNIKMGNYTQMALTDPNIDLSFNFPTVSATVFGTASLGLTIYGAVYACVSATDGTAADIVACIAGPIATILGSVTGYLYARSGAAARVNQDIDLATGTFTNVRKREAMDSALHSYLGELLPGSSHVGYMYHAQYDQPSPMYEIEPMPGHKVHISAFINDGGSITHHLHFAEETEIAKRAQGISERAAPYPYNGIRWGRGGFDWNLCPYSGAGNAGLAPDPSTYYNAFYDQITCIFPTTDPYKASTAMQADLYDTNSVLVADIEIIPYGATFSSGAPSCNSSPPPINGDCQIN